ncbi:hypothetical protein K4A83_06645 [Spirulina subsalsa FACHB-351]|uniref:N-acetyltransferase domain-containing protein n=1 Tax=Spirulina subsalsa FACHB-351 TaxID=234711 RepID=A0ABT3L4P4_9CYAN|nr:hypothetical protein [Spirulina subsalsa]MCW6035950.1 hypothetical protein [Spirulina subsalsa FACHB-351]
MTYFSISSTLKTSYRDDLERLMFFNPHQGKVREQVMTSIEVYGQPKILEEEGFLKITLDSDFCTQCLFALDTREQLIGVIIYVRASPDHLVITHVAVQEDYASGGMYQDRFLVFRLVARVREIGQQIKGIQWVSLIYGLGKEQKIPVFHGGASRQTSQFQVKEIITT